jgi:uncharacterized protein
MSRIVRLVLGYAFLALGLVGLVLPILQGVLFTMVGLVLLSRDVPWARRALAWFASRYPRAGAVVARSDAWITRRGRLARVRIGRWLRPAVR